jgi:hypothetical protein
MRRIFSVFLTSLTLVVLFIPGTVLAQNGVDDLRGRWDFYVDGLGQDFDNFIVYIDDIKYSQDVGAFLANGCMKSPSQMLSPLALKAEYRGNGSYNVSITSTVIPSGDGNPFVIQFFGPFYTFGPGVPDDIAGGDDSRIRTEFIDGGMWTAMHHDREKKSCPAVEIPPLSFSVDVRAQQNLRGGQAELIKTILEAQTDIASSGALVEKPDGTKVTLPPYTDIFSPDVDFVSKFRYTIPFDQADNVNPIAGQPYFFTLLDVLGNPIPGSLKTDTWTGCFISAPRNFVANISSNNDIDIEWDEVPKVDGFDPANGVGFYQIEIGGWNPWSPDIYGSNLIKSTTHIVPWNDFIPPSPGYPDGYDLGVGLSKFPDDRTYGIRIEAFSRPPIGSGGQNHECVIVDFDENIYFQKTVNGISLIE